MLPKYLMDYCIKLGTENYDINPHADVDKELLAFIKGFEACYKYLKDHEVKPAEIFLIPDELANNIIKKVYEESK